MKVNFFKASFYVDGYLCNESNMENVTILFFFLKFGNWNTQKSLSFISYFEIWKEKNDANFSLFW